MEKPISYWLDLLPDGYRERAHRAYNKKRKLWQLPTASNMADAISGMCTWRETVERDTFWRAVCYHYRYRHAPRDHDYVPLPPLPTTHKARARRT